MMGLLMTTLGAKNAQEVGLILPHEHIFVDLRTPDTAGHGQAAEADVVFKMAPQLEQAKAAGVSALVECTPEGVGRRVDLAAAVSRAAQFPVVIPTGIYREPWVPGWAHSASEEQLRAWMQGELEGFIAGTGVQAGWIKLSAGDNGLTPVETKILRAAARAGRAAGSAIGSHTIRGWVARDQLGILAEAGFPAQRFIHIHAQAEEDFAVNLELARRGAWIEYDNLGWEPEKEPALIERIRGLIAARLVGRVLLSHDMGWYDPAQPRGGTPRPFTYLTQTFLPALRAAGISEMDIQQMTVANPFRAFARI
jgi:phosphotriesterase-related protein